MSRLGWETELSDRKEPTHMSTTTQSSTIIAAALSEKHQSVLFELRALAPPRRMSHLESLRLAETQAARLRSILGVMNDWFPTDAIAGLPRVTVQHVADLPASGASFWGQGSWHIHVHASEPERHQRFTVLHELKHIIDHPMQRNVYDERAFVVYGEREIIADYFAACLLIPEDRLRAAHATTRDHDELAARFGVTTRRILHRLSEIGLTETVTSIPQRTIRTEDYLTNTNYETEGRIA